VEVLRMMTALIKLMVLRRLMILRLENSGRITTVRRVKNFRMMTALIKLMILGLKNLRRVDILRMMMALMISEGLMILG